MQLRYPQSETVKTAFYNDKLYKDRLSLMRITIKFYSLSDLRNFNFLV